MITDAYAREIAALLIADIKTSGARTREEIVLAIRTSLVSLLGDAPVPGQISVLLPAGHERWPKIVVTPRRRP